MKKTLFVIFITVLIIQLNSLGTLRVESIKELPPTHTNLEVRDADGKWAPVLIVKTELKGLGFKNIGRPTKHAPIYNEKKNEYKFYMNDKQRVVEITHSEYEPLVVRLLADYNIEVHAQRVYEMVLTNVPEKVFINVVIISKPSDAEKIIDGENLGTGQTFKLFIGKHTLEVQKEGYISKTKTITVSESSTLFKDIKLEEIEQVMITIKSVPTGATIYLNNDEIGKTNKQPFRFPGNYNLRLVKNKYEKIEETITVTETGNNIFSYHLEKSTVMLTISINPSDADIYLNNEKLTGNIQEISPGKHKIEVRKTGYFSQTRTIEVQKGKDITESFTLKKKTGKLQFVVEPMEANVTLKKDEKTIDNWKGSKYKTNLQIGEYQIIASLTGYEPKTKKCTIDLNKTAQVSITLEPETRVGLDSQIDSGFENMIFVKGGTFQMGSNEYDDEKPIHSVTLSDFYIGKYEVTQKEWKAIMGNNPSNWKGDDLPVEKVSWYNVVEFCNKKSEAEGLTPCYTGSGKNTKCNFSANGYRLPTEAEWEYAARGGNKSKDYKFSGSNNIGDVAWYYKNSNSKTHKVGTKQPNELGIYDMSGNVWEWCNDWYSKNYYKNSSKNNPQGPTSGKYLVLRGGGWINSAGYCRSSDRYNVSPDGCTGNGGFRIARTSK
ncbi:MAG: SUMF1/EgtB/PvdO family nonheme iron enzyme [Candidatus Cloacimonetes bacterium]|nr:SUMF1/EgtB/PvdO family nonheme iron enzyme [Candidatus Cloacimonadota bacterium]